MISKMCKFILLFHKILKFFTLKLNFETHENVRDKSFFSYATPPDKFRIEYRDERTVEFEKYKRNIVLLHINSYELSALVRQIAEFCPEGVTVTMSEVRN